MSEIMKGATVLLPSSIIAQVLFTALNGASIAPFILLAGLGLASVFGFCVATSFFGAQRSALIAISIAIGLGLGFVSSL